MKSDPPIRLEQEVLGDAVLGTEYPTENKMAQGPHLPKRANAEMLVVMYLGLHPRF